MQGGYHGHLDDTLVDREGARTVPALLGISVQVARRARVVPFNQPDALDEALAPGDVAAVIAEPALTNIRVVQPAPRVHSPLRPATTQAVPHPTSAQTATPSGAWV